MTRRLLASLLILGLGCIGDIGSTPDERPPEDIGNEPPPLGTDPMDLPPLEDPRSSLCDDRSGEVSQAPLRRLSRAEFEASLRALFPAAVIDEVNVWLGALPAETTRHSPAEFVPGTTQQDIDSTLEVALRVAGLVARNDAYLRVIANECMLGNADDACLDAFLEDFGARVLRAPLSRDDLADFRDAYRADEGIVEDRDRVEVLLGALLTAPEFTHHVVRAAEGERAILDPFTLASRISFAVSGAGPDDALLSAAAAGELDELSAREAHARRLLDTNAGRTHVRALFTRWLGLHGQYSPELAADLAGVPVDGLYDELREEALDYVEHVVFDERGSFDALMTSKKVFPSTERLAELLGTVRSDEGVETSSRRAGLLTRPALLISNNPRTSPILRGLFIWERFLCEEFTLPENVDVDAIAAERLADFDGDNATSRERTEAMTGTPDCAACHNRINPPGFALAHFGPLGEEWNETETVFEADGSVLAEVPLEGDANVAGLFLDDESHVVEGAESMASLISDSETGRSCAARQVFRATHLREPIYSDGCHVQDIVSAFDEGASIFDILVLNAAQETPFVPGVTP